VHAVVIYICLLNVITVGDAVEEGRSYQCAILGSSAGSDIRGKKLCMYVFYGRLWELVTGEIWWLLGRDDILFMCFSYYGDL
jgi:hypothetical protein